MSSPRPQDDRAGRQSAVPRPGFVRSFSFAGQGVWYAVRTQRNMRVHLLAAACAVTAGLVLTTEALNTVVEALADLCTEEFHPLAKIAKDTAAGAVLISSVTALGVGAAIFLPRLLRSPG